MLGGVYTKTTSVKNEHFVFAWRQSGIYTNKFPPKLLHFIVIINGYPSEFHVTTIPHDNNSTWQQLHVHESRDSYSDISSKQVAANKRKQFFWTNDEAELLLAVTHDYKIKNLVEGTCNYRQT